MHESNVARAGLAARFFKELNAQHDSLCELAENFGTRTLSDLFYLHAALLEGGFIDAHPDSSVLAVVDTLPGAQLWRHHISEYDGAGRCVRECEAAGGKPQTAAAGVEQSAQRRELIALADVTLALAIPKDQADLAVSLSADGINDMLRELQRTFSPGSFLLDYSLGTFTLTNARALDYVEGKAFQDGPALAEHAAESAADAIAVARAGVAQSKSVEIHLDDELSIEFEPEGKGYAVSVCRNDQGKTRVDYTRGVSIQVFASEAKTPLHVATFDEAMLWPRETDLARELALGTALASLGRQPTHPIDRLPSAAYFTAALDGDEILVADRSGNAAAPIFGEIEALAQAKLIAQHAPGGTGVQVLGFAVDDALEVINRLG